MLQWGGPELIPPDLKTVLQSNNIVAGERSSFTWTFAGIHQEVGFRCLPRRVRPVSLTASETPAEA